MAEARSLYSRLSYIYIYIPILSLLQPFSLQQQFPPFIPRPIQQRAALMLARIKGVAIFFFIFSSFVGGDFSFFFCPEGCESAAGRTAGPSAFGNLIREMYKWLVDWTTSRRYW